MSHKYNPLLFADWKPLAQLLRRFASYAIASVLILICLAGIPEYIVQGLSLFRLDEAGYGDSYILYDVLNFQKTGRIYRNLAEPPFLPAQYSPLVYILYSLPGRVMTWENPFVAPRLFAIFAVLACIALTASIVRALFPSGVVWLWGLLLPFSIRITPIWILQLRGDFPGISLSLLSIRFLLSEWRWAVPLAAVCGGLAVQLKFTFVAAASAGAAWLLVQRRWVDLVRFIGFFAAASLGPYVLYSLREPEMVSQMFALSPGVRNVAGNLLHLNEVAGELAILLTLVGLASMDWRASSKETLAGLYLATSFAVGAVTAMHVGANVNYYLETLFASIPIAVLGMFRLMELARRHTALGPALAAFLAFRFLLPLSIGAYYESVPMVRKGWVESGNDEMRQLSQALAGSRIFSSVPRLALMDPNPPLTEPYLLSYMHLLGKVRMEPFTNPVRGKEYDVVITYDSPVYWRNVSQLDPELRSAIAESYEPYCTFHQGLFHIPIRTDASTSALAERLKHIGCVPVSAEGRKNW